MCKQTADFSLDDKRVTSLNAQIGLLFDGFRVSYEMMNPFYERYNNKIHSSTRCKRYKKYKIY